MSESLLRKAFRDAPLTTAATAVYGLEHAPRFTLSVFNGLLAAEVVDHVAGLEERAFAKQLSELMGTCGPWKLGPDTASQSRATLERLPTGTKGTTLLDPYYFDFSMVYADDSYEDDLFTYAYRLHSCGVFATNYDPMKDDALLVDAAVCFAYLRGTDLWGKPHRFTAIWKEGLPLGGACAFSIPRWGVLRREAAAEESTNSLLALLRHQCEEALATKGATEPEIMTVLRRVNGEETLPTPVESGFPNLSGTVWHGAEPFPALENFELELIGADHRQRGQSVPEWLRAARGALG